MPRSRRSIFRSGAEAGTGGADRRCRLAKITVASVLAHGGPIPSGPARGIPAEVMTEPAPPEKRPAAPGEATQTPSREPRQMLETEANPKPANEAMCGPNLMAKPAAPQPSAPHGPGAGAKPERNDIVDKEIAHERKDWRAGRAGMEEANTSG